MGRFSLMVRGGGAAAPAPRPAAEASRAHTLARTQVSGRKPSASAPWRASKASDPAPTAAAALPAAAEGAAEGAAEEEDWKIAAAAATGEGAEPAALDGAEAAAGAPGTDVERAPPPPAERVGSRRPAAASPRAARPPLTERVANFSARPPATWTAAEVADWVDSFGFGQYRRRFVHHALTGALLLKLTDEQLRADLGVGPLGHREAILRAVVDLHRAGEAAGDAVVGVGAPAPAARRPSGLVAAELRAAEQRTRLEHELAKAEARAARRRAVAEGAARAAGLADAEAARLRAAVEAARGAASPAGAAGADAATGVDSRGLPVWSPAGRLARTVSGAPPAPPPRSAARRGPTGATFVERLEADLAARQAKLAAGRGDAAAPAARRGSAAAEDALSFLCSLFADRDAALQAALRAEAPAEAAAALDAAAAQLAADLALDPSAVVRARAAAAPGLKALRLAAAVRTSQFMERLAADLGGRGERLRELHARWEADEAEAAAAREARAAAAATEEFARLGWPADALGAGGAGELVAALLRRAEAEREARAAGKEADWSRFRGDGLVALLPAGAAPAAPAVAAPAAAAPAAASGGAAPLADAAAAPAGAGAGGSAALREVVSLLARCRPDELKRVTALAGRRQLLAAHRALRAQRFIAQQAADVGARDAKVEEARAATAPPKGAPLPKERLEGFLLRLQEDAAKRAAAREKLAAAAEPPKVAAPKARRAPKAPAPPNPGPSS
jgi:hypothetical protein